MKEKTTKDASDAQFINFLASYLVRYYRYSSFSRAAKLEIGIGALPHPPNNRKST